MSNLATGFNFPTDNLFFNSFLSCCFLRLVFRPSIFSEGTNCFSFLLVIGRGVCEQKESFYIEMEGDISVNGDPNTYSNSNQDSKKSEAKDEPAKTVPLYRLFSFADPLDHLLMFVGTVGAIGNGISLPLMTLIFGNMINAFGESSNTNEVVDEVSKVSLKFVYLAVGTFFASFLQLTCWMITGDRQAARIRGLYLQTILRQDVSFFDKETNTGEVVGRMSGDTVLIQDAMGEKVGQFIQLISTFFGGFVVAFIKGWLLTVVMLSCIPLLVMSGAMITVIISRASSEGQAAYSTAASVVEQTIGSIRTVASFTGERLAIAKYNQSLNKAYKTGVQEALASGLGFGLLYFVFICSYGLAVWFGAKMIIEKGYTGGKVVTVIFAVLTGSMSLGQASPSLSAFAAGQAAAFKMFETIKRKPEIDAYDTTGRKLEDIRGDIELREVCFSYPTRPDELIFNGFSLSIPSGTTAALVGQSGSGKSTVVSLIERFYDPQSGAVLIDGINLREFQLKWIRQKIGLVSQEPVLFTCSIKENIAYGKDGATDEEIRAAAELANAAKFIDKLPQGLDTMVGEHGTQLSGGQKQRVAIARAILKDPRILLLDEATSALDTESERIVQEALDRIMINRTTVIVAHRLSTIRNADTIAVIHLGKIVERGSHVELTKDPDGAYSQLIRLQEIKRLEKNVDVREPESIVHSGRHSSKRSSFLRSISQESLGVGNSGRHSFSASFGVPTSVGFIEPAGEGPQDPPSTAPSPPEVPLYRLAYLNKPEILVLLMGTVSAVITGVILPVFGLLLSKMISIFYEPAHELRKDSKVWAIVFVGLGAVSFLVYPGRFYFFGVAGGKLIQRIRKMCFEKVVHMEVSWFDEAENSSGAIGARLSTDAASVRALVGDALGLLVQNTATAIAGLVIAFESSWQLALIILALVPLLGLNGYLQFKFLKGFSADTKKLYEEASQVANDAVGSIRTVASFCAEEKVMELYQEKCEGPIKTGKRQGIISGISFGVSFFVLYSVYATSFYAGARLVEDRKATFTDVFRVFFALSMAAIGISQSGSLVPDSTKAKGAAASIFAILDRKSEIDPSDDTGMTLEEFKGEIELKHVSFKYPTRPDVQIFRDLSLTIHSGKTVALVGESGSGKSTVISLLQRFYDPDSGHITLDGTEIQRMQVKWLRQQMGLVSQEPVLFNDTIRANIAYGKADATEAEIITAAELANAHTFISNEATSALDAESEKVVQDALDRVMVDRTTIVVAHRLSTIKGADLIAVVKNGVIAEKGKHEALLNKGGDYASLVALHTIEECVKPSNKKMAENIDLYGDSDIKQDSKSKVKDESAKTVPLYKLFSFADPLDHLLMFVGAVGAIGNGISMPLMTLIFGNMINAFGATENSNEVVDEVSKVSLKFVYLAVGTFFASLLQLTCWMITGERQAARIRGLYLQNILRQDVSFFDKETRTGEVVGRMSGDTVLIQDAMGEKVAQFIQLMTTFVGGFVIAFSRGWLLTLVMLSSIPPLVLCGSMLGLIITKASSRAQAAYSIAASIVEQTIGSVRTVASFTGEKQAIDKYNQSIIKAYRAGVQEALATGLGFGSLYFVFNCSYSLATWFGAKMVIEKGYTGGEVVTVIMAVLTGSMSLGQASPSLSAFAAGQAAAFKMFETIKRKPEIDAYDTTGRQLDDIRGDIELREVCFSYPTRPDELIFNGFSLSIPSGTTTALVGESGSGKSTVVGLIERFYDPQAGEVLIDSINLKEFKLKWIRQKIGLVSQEPVLFTCSIKENIAYGKDGATVEEIRAAAELANAAKFIDKLPQGLDTMVGEHGAQLSGGQKQRVAIARAILKDPRILLLDEATSALDAESEKIVQEALNRIMINRTTVIVAHRLSTIRNADSIAVMHQGKIVERGSHAELTRDPIGAYSQLIRLQEVKRSGQNVANETDKLEGTAHFGRQSSQRSFLQAISQRSSEVGSSGRNSFSESHAVGFLEPAGGVPQTSPTVSSPPEVPLYRLAYLNKPETPVLLAGSIAAIINGVLLPIVAIFMSKMISIFYEPADELRKDSKLWALLFVVLGVVSFIMPPCRFYLFGVAGGKLIKRIRKLCFEKVVHMEVSWFDEAEHSSGAIGARLSSDVAAVRALVGDALGLLVQNIATAVGGLVIAFEASWQLALIMLALAPLLVLNGYVQFKFLKGFSANSKKLYEEASQVANDAVGSIRTVASFCSEKKVMKLYQEKCEGPIRTGIRRGIISGISYGVSFFMLYAVYACSFYAGARLIEDGKSTFSDVFRVFFALSMTAMGISQSGSLVPDSSNSKSAAASVFAILDQKSQIDPSDDSGLTLEEVKGEIEFNHVSFKYPTRPDVQIFRDLSLTIHSGKTVALVGESGSGKSTVISLLQRFYDLDSGHITLDRNEIQRMQIKWLRQQMGLVSQEPVLFNDTIRANIAYGKGGDATEAEIIAAAELANAHNFTCSLQKGYDTIVGERGIQLSGGQKQRVAIARAIVKNPKILLLDEATSALDAESEKVVQDALDRVMVDRTTIVVAHRLSTIKGADLIAVVKNGVIAEKGKHEALLNKGEGCVKSFIKKMAQDIALNRDSDSKEDSKSKAKDKTVKTVPLYKLFSFADPLDNLLMFLGTVGAIGNGVSIPLTILMFGNMINAFGGTENSNVVDEVSKVSLKFVYFAVGTFLLSLLQLTCWMVTGERQATRIRGLYLKTILRQDVTFFDKETRTGEVVGRMSGDTVLIQDAMGEKVGQFLQFIATFIGSFAVAFIKGWLLTVVMLSCIPPLALVGAVLGQVISKASSRGQEAYSIAATVAEQTIGSIRTVASFTGEKQAIANYNQSLTKAYKAGVQGPLASGLGFGALYFVFTCSYGLATWFGAKMIIEKGYTGGEVITVIVAVLNGSMSLGQASPSLSAFAAGQAAAFKMFETIKRKPEIDAYDTTGRQLDDIRGDIELREVCFSYPTRPDELIFNGFSLSIPSGTTTALVGESGSGKSTVVGLIERFYDPQAGEVLIDSINLKEFKLKWIRQKIGLVSQEPVLFTCSIKENIAYGKDGATDEEIRAAAELANAAKFIDKLPLGLDTMVGEHGAQLSGGQKQRVAIARAILKDPRILLLDEATSALDAESEKIVQEALDRIMINRTTVIVAHRLSTIRNADSIAVIHQGKIVERGSHAELTKDPNGAYRQLIRLQEIKGSEKNAANDTDKIESIVHSGRQSSQRSSIQSISQRSSGVGSSGCNSFSESHGVPATVGFLEPSGGRPQAPPSTVSSPPEVPLYRLAYLNKPEIPFLLIGTIAAVGSGVILPILALFISKMISIFYEPVDELHKDSKHWALLFVALGVVSFVMPPCRFYLFGIAGGKLIKRIRKMCFEKVVHMEVSWFDEAEHSSGAIGARLSSDAAAVRALVGDALGLLVQNIATAVAGLVIAFDASWQLALIILALAPLLALNGYVQLKVLKGFSADAKKLYEEASQVANDALGSIRTVASFCAEKKVMKSYEEKCEGPIRTGIRRGIISGISYGVSFFMLYAVYACSFYAGARLVQDGKATMLDVFRVFFALNLAAVGISQSGSLVPDSSNSKSAAASVFAILDRKSQIDPSDDSGLTLEEVQGEIEFKHVSFKYPTRPDVQIFRDLCLTIHNGKTVALVGESGSGKSTVISLLQRFYDPDLGNITLDGTEIQRMQVKWLRQQMGLVSQEPVLFNDTIRANIAYGKGGDATEAEIIAAAELANAHNFTCSLQEGYDTIVGERGIQLSGGQKQRVAIARAIVKNPKILLLDEATSALDAESEKVVQDALDCVMVDRTTIVVAHRLSTIKGAGLIAVVKNGVIAEKGKHEALLNKGGDYASLASLNGILHLHSAALFTCKPREVLLGEMVAEACLDGDTISNETTGSTSDHPPVQGPENTQEMDGRQQDSKKNKVKGESNKTVPFYKLFSFADSWDCLLMVVGAISAVGNGISMPLMTILIGDAIDAFGGNVDNKQAVVHQVYKASLKFASIGAGAFLAAFLQVSCWVITGERQTARIRGLYLKAILRQDISFFDKETVERLLEGCQVGKFIQYVACFFGGIAMAFIKGWLLSLVLLSSLPLLVLSGSVMSFAFAKMASRGQTAYSEAATVVERTIGSIRTVASFTGEKQARAQYDEYLTKAYRVGVQEGVAGGFGFGLVRLFIYCTYGLAVWFGGKMVLEKGYTGGQVISVFFAVLTGSMSLGQASPSLTAFAAGQAAAFKTFETIKRRPDIDAYEPYGQQPYDIPGDIELREVCFSYPSRPDELIFNGFSISIPSGTTAALVGQSGSGKSTVISFIERFYDQQAGEVLIDGINLREFQLKWIRQKISLVSQEPVLFAYSIKENIAYGKDGATHEEIRAAADLANAAKFIDIFPNILDRIMINRTTVIVAHCLSTIRNADVIAVIHQGTVIEKAHMLSSLKILMQLLASSLDCKKLKGNQNSMLEMTGWPENFVDSERQLSQRLSFPESLSRGSSGRRNGCQHSFEISNAMPTSPDLFETSEGGPEILPSVASHKPQEVSLLCVTYLNKPEIPVSSSNWAILPTVGLLLSHMINTFFEPADELRKDSNVAAFIFLPLRSYLFSVAGSKLIKRIRLMCFEKIIHMEIGWFDKAENSSGALGARLSTDAASIRTLVGDALGLLVQDFATAITALVIAFDANWKLSLIILVLVPLLLLNGHLQIKSMQGFSTNVKKLYEEASQVASDAVGNIRTVAAFCAEEKVMELYQKKCLGPIQTGIRQGLVSGTGFGLSLFFLFSVYACSFYAGARLVESGKTSISDVFRVFFALSMAAIAMSQSGFMTPAASKAKSSAASVFAILDQKSRIDPSDESGMTLQEVNGEIGFHHVTFKYPTRPNVLVFKDLSLNIHAGETVALVGESGSGKSTVISLLQRFYGPDSGQITLDGTEIQKLQLKWFRRQMGLVSQEPVLFNDTIRANIGYGKCGDATEAEIIAAAELANAHKFISSLQQKDSKKNKVNDESNKTVPFYKLFAFADSWDYLLIFVGTISAAGNGITKASTNIIMGEAIDAFRGNGNTKQVVHEVSKVSLKFALIGAASFLAAFLQVACWVSTGERQAARIRGLYLRAILRQDISFFDKETNTGEVVGRMSGDTLLIQEALGEKVGKFIQCVACFLGGLVIAFIKGWLLTLVLLSCIPPLVISGSMMSFAFAKLASRGQAAYSEAATVVERTIGSIRTVASFTGENQAIAQYNQSLTKAYKTAVQDGVAAGLGLGSIRFFINSSFALAVWFGGKMVLDKGYTPGQVMSIFLALFYASMSLGQVSANLTAFSAGQAAAFKIFETINRHPDIDAYDTAGRQEDDISGDIELKEGLDTIVGEHATQLSGGQKQRIAIARVILKDPRILLLDEATSALDAESERVVQETLDKIMINRTTVIVAHRLNTIRNADTIAVIHQGRVVENGKHAELIKDPDGAYSRLIKLQEINRQSDGANDSDQLENLVDSEQQSSQQFPFPQSLNLGSSGRGISSHHSFRISNAMPTTLDLLKTSEGRPEVLPPAVSHSTPEVSMFLHLAYLNKPEIPMLVLGTLAATVTGAILPLMGFLISNMINTFFEPGDELRKDSKFWALIFIALGVAGFIFQPLRSYLFAVAGSKLIKRIRLICFEKIINMEVGWFDKAEHSSGVLGARLSVDVASIRTFVGDALGLIVQDIVTVIIALAIAFEANWQLSLIILVLLPLLLVNGQVQMGSMQGFVTDAKKLYEEASQVANEAVGNIRTVVAFCAEEKVMELYQKKCLGPIQTGIKQGLVSGTSFGLSLFLVFSVNACCFYAGARLVENGKTSISDVFRVFCTLTMAAVAMSQSGFMAPGASKAKSSVASIFSILDQKSNIDPSYESGMTLQEVKGEIEFNHVTFKYPTRPNVIVFRDFSLTVHAGETVALAGESGSGKSTVISLLQRFYEPDSGQITLDGTKIQNLQLKWFRQQMGLVSQEPVLFNDTIRANIAYGKCGDATEAEIIAAAELANAHKFISSLQQGYDALVGERGIQLSGGQKQRVAIARAIVKSPKILLLDEATSALDAESERVVQDALDRVRVDRTTIVVAHRLSTIKDADSIAVVENGVIAEHGKHDTLLNKGGIYASLVGLHTNLASS
ncbi:ABC transporter B family member 11 [Glycine soja]